MGRRSPAKTNSTTTVYWLEKDEDLDSPGSPVEVPLTFLVDLGGNVLRLRGFEIKVRGGTVCYYRQNKDMLDDYTFVAGTMTPQQMKMVYG